jgi:hypothetical protein
MYSEKNAYLFKDVHVVALGNLHLNGFAITVMNLIQAGRRWMRLDVFIVGRGYGTQPIQHLNFTVLTWLFW